MSGLELPGVVLAVIPLTTNVASLCYDYARTVRHAPDDIKRLAEEVDSLKAAVRGLQQLLQGPHGQSLSASAQLQHTLGSCSSQLSRLENKLEPGRARKLMMRVGSRLAWPFKAKEVDAIIRSLDVYKQTIALSLQTDLVENSSRISQNTDALVQKAVLASLRIARGATFDSHKEEHNATCHPDTRVELLRDVARWADDSSSQCVFWLNGKAGTGKSTISRTVSRSFAARGQLGASFFFKRGEGDRGSATLFFSTIAFQLVRNRPSLAKHVQNAIEGDPAVTGKAMKEQFDKLVLQPLRNSCAVGQNPTILVVVVDALDECGREDDIRTIIRLLPQAKHLDRARLRFFVTSRPELPARLGFNDISGDYDDLVLHQVPRALIGHDIAVFIKDELRKIRADHNTSNPRQQLSVDWPGPECIQQLVDMAVPLFIFAKTMCLFIGDQPWGPDEKLKSIMEYQTMSQESQLDATYLPVLDRLLVKRTNDGMVKRSRREVEAVIGEFREVVGAIVVLAEPLSIASIAGLLGVSISAVNRQLGSLHSVLNIPSNENSPVRLFHLSFRDFLLDPDKHDTNPFWVDERAVHEKLAGHCLRLLSTKAVLRKDMCNLRMPGARRVEVDQQNIATNLPGHVQYACRFWVHHLKNSKAVITDNDKAHTFVSHGFLHWLEAMSLMGRVSETVNMIDDLLTMADNESGLNALAFIRDAKRFVLCYRLIIDLSPLQLYASALIFAPMQCIIRQTFNHYIPKWISPLPIVDSNWSAVLQTLEGHAESVTSVVFSSDNKLIASGSWDTTIKVWDMVTGSEVQLLRVI